MPQSETIAQALERVLTYFPSRQREGKEWKVLCPGHADKRPSLNISAGEKGVILRCRSGCETEAIMAALGRTMADLFPRGLPDHSPAQRPEIVATYDYCDASGTLRYQTVRYRPKDFRQRRPDGSGGWTWQLDDVPRVLTA
jgi:putative DNA primase/helicase